MENETVTILTTPSTIGVVGEETTKQETIKILNAPPIQDEKPLKKKKTSKKKTNTQKPNTHSKKTEVELSFHYSSNPSTNASGSNTTSTTTTTSKGRRGGGSRKTASSTVATAATPSVLPFCPHFYSCNDHQDPRHNKGYRHICSLGQSCTQKDDPKHSRLWYHFDLPVCPKLKECEQLTDPAHRAAFHHPGFTDSMQPCRFHKDCKKTEDRNHLLRYQHSDIFYFPQDGKAPTPEFASIASKNENPSSPSQKSENLTSSTNFPPLDGKKEQETEKPAEKEEIKKEEAEKSAEKETIKKDKCEPFGVPADVVDAAYAAMNTTAASSKKEHSNNNNNNNNLSSRKDKRSDSGEKALSPCTHPFECRVKIDEGHPYYHACALSKSDCHHYYHVPHKGKMLNGALHNKQYVHYANEKCRLGKACPFVYDPQHRAYFSHLNEPDFLIPCKFATKCKLLDDPQHRLRFQHFESHFFPPFPSVFTPEMKAPISHNEGLPLCNAFFACPLVLADPAHEAATMHACPWGQDCEKRADKFHSSHYYHYDHPLCDKGGECLSLNDPLHRAQYHHKGLPDFVAHCGFGRNCTLISNPEHCNSFQHGAIPIMPCIPPVAVGHFVDLGKKAPVAHQFGGNGGKTVPGKPQGFQVNIFSPMMFYQKRKGLSGEKVNSNNNSNLTTTTATAALQNNDNKLE